MKPLEPYVGEIIGPDEKARFYLFEHALKSNRHICEVPAGLSISEALDLSLEDTGWRNKYRHNFTIFLQDGTLIPEHMWDRVRLKKGTAAIARPVAEGPLFAIFGALSSIFTGISGFFAGLGFFGKLLLTGLTMGLKFLLNKLFAPKPPKPDASDRTPVYSIVGSRNEVTQWAPIPLILGRHRITPPLAATPYTETIGDDQYLRQLFCNGYGPLNIETGTVKIGETPITDYPEAQVEHRQGFVTDTDTTLYPADVIEIPKSVGLKSTDPYAQEVGATDTINLALDFMWPNGLCVINQEGKRTDRQAVILVNYRTAGPPAGAWSGDYAINIMQHTQKTVRRTLTIGPLPPNQYEVRVKKASPEMDQATMDHFHWTIMEDVVWTALRSLRTGKPVTFTDAPLSVSAIRVRASERLNQQIDTYNVVVSSMVTAWNGSAWVANTPSRRPPDLFRHVLTCKANRRPFPLSQIDLPALQAWWTYCVNEGWYYDKIINNQMSVYDLISEICVAGRAMPVFKDGKWSVVWDDQNVPVAQLFTPRNSWNFEEQRDLDPIPHGYRIRFPNEVKGWREDERIVYNDGYNKSNATLLEGFEVSGVTHSNRLWRHGRFHLAQRILRPGVFTLYASWDALPLVRGDRVRVNYDTFLYGLYSGRVVAVDATAQIVTMDTNVTLAGATNYGFRFRLANGTFLERTIDPGYVGEFTTVGLVGTGMPMPAVGDLFSLGYVSNDSRVLRVTGIEPEENLVHRLSLVADAPEIADADTGQIPDYSEGISQPIDPYLMPPSNIQLTDGVYADGGPQYWANIHVSWSGPPYGRVVQFQVQYREDSDPPDIWTAGGSVGPNVFQTEIRRLESGIYTVRVRCLFDNNKFSSWAYAPPKATTEFTTPPPDVTDFRITVMGDISILRWQAIPDVGITYEIRWAAEAVSLPTWNAAIVLGTSSTDTYQLGTRTGTFFIKAKKPWGLSSVNAKYISSLVGTWTGLNVITSITENPNWTGTHSNTEKVVAELRLKADPTGTVYAPEGIYYFANRIDLGELISSRVSIVLDAYGFDPQQTMATWLALSSVDPLDSTQLTDWSVQPQYRASTVNPSFNQWSDWLPFGLTDILAWAIEFRLVLRGKLTLDIETDVMHSVTTPAIKQAIVTIDMTDRIEKGEDVISGAGVITIIYPNGAYREPPAVVITPQDMVQGDYYKVTTKTDTSFKVQFWNAANATVSKKFDWMAKGWGRVR